MPALPRLHAKHSLNRLPPTSSNLPLAGLLEVGQHLQSKIFRADEVKPTERPKVSGVWLLAENRKNYQMVVHEFGIEVSGKVLRGRAYQSSKTVWHAHVDYEWVSEDGKNTKTTVSYEAKGRTQHAAIEALKSKIHSAIFN